MSFDKQLPWNEGWSLSKARDDYACIRCEQIIPKAERRIKEKRSAYFCFHLHCFKEEYGDTGRELVDTLQRRRIYG